MSTNSETMARHHAYGTDWRPTREEEVALVLRAQAGDRTANATLIKVLYRLVLRLTSRYKKSADFDDIISEGLLGAQRGIELFDPSFGTRLSTYAGRWIKQRVQRFSQLNKTVHVPVGQLDGRAGTRYQLHMSSLDAPIGDDGETTGFDFLPAEDLSPEDQVADALDGARLRARLDKALAGCSARNRALLEARFFGDDGDTERLEAVGDRFGITRERVRQIETAFRDRLRRNAAAILGDSAERVAAKRPKGAARLVQDIQVGDRFGAYKVVRFAGYDRHSNLRLDIECECGLRRQVGAYARYKLLARCTHRRRDTTDPGTPTQPAQPPLGLDLRARAAQWAIGARQRLRVIASPEIAPAPNTQRCLQCRQLRPVSEMTRGGRVRVHCTGCVVRRKRLYNPGDTVDERLAAIRGASARQHEPTPAPDGPRVSFVASSKNKKLGPIPMSMSERGTCPSSCAFYDVGCYASYAWNGDMWRKTRSTGLSWSDFLRQVRSLPPGTLWRHNEAGDLAGDAAGTTIDSTALDEIAEANRGRRGFTYTHRTRPLLAGDDVAIDDVFFANYAGFTVNLSADSVEEADALFDLHIAPVVVTLPKDAPRVGLRSPGGRAIVVCPAQTTPGITCARCQLCAKADRKSIVGFLAHGAASRLVSELVRSKRPGVAA